MKFADTIKPKSDQLNAIDLLDGNKIIKVTDVKIVSDAKQPVIIRYDGDGGKPYKPNLTMRRILYFAWGDDETKFIGRSMELFRNPDVVWGGEKAGGIEISKMTNLPKGERLRVSLQTSKTVRKIFTVEPLTAPVAKLDKQREKAELFANNIKQMIAGGATWEAIESENGKALERIKEVYPELYEGINNNIK